MIEKLSPKAHSVINWPMVPHVRREVVQKLDALIETVNRQEKEIKRLRGLIKQQGQEADALLAQTIDEHGMD